MFYFEYPTTDTTLYEGNITSSINTGLDEILEVSKNVNSSGTTISVSRALLKFDYSYISSSVQSGIIPSDAKYYLNLYLRVAQDSLLDLVHGLVPNKILESL